MSDYGGIERRKYVRVPFSFVLRYKAAGAGKVTHAPVTFTASATKDISAGGILFPATINMPIGTELEIELNLSAIPFSTEEEALTKYRAVKVKGRVVRTEEIIKGELFNIGFVIDDIVEKDRKALEQFIEFFIKRERLRNKVKFGVSGSEYIGPERRKFIRVPYTFIVKYSKDETAKETDNHYCLNSNISACGVVLETHEKFDIASRLSLEMVIPGDDQVVPIQIKGRVVRSEELVLNELYETGIAFEEVKKEDQDVLYRFLTEFSKGNDPKGPKKKK